MEQHPIPQDVTGFQFKLIGTMTVKQFGYVAGGAILAVICWYAPGPNIFWNLLKFSLMPVFALSGVIIAFVPIEGRPVDVMAASFFHALITPNQYVYIKRGRKFSFNEIVLAKPPAPKILAQQVSAPGTRKAESKKEQQLRALLSSSYKEARNTLDKKELAFLQSISSLPQASSAPAPQPQIVHRAAIPSVHTPTATNMAPIQTNLSSDSLAQPPLSAPPVPKPVDQPPKPVDSPALDAAHVRSIPQNLTRGVGLSHVPDAPNIISGIVKDSRGNVLPNILVEVKDSAGNPVRAFKTNPLGQFASATSLTNGVYTVELEDPKKQHAFNVVQINAQGQIMLPIEIISHDAREALRQALFTN